jgi:hypothetical protein
MSNVAIGRMYQATSTCMAKKTFCAFAYVPIVYTLEHMGESDGRTDLEIEKNNLAPTGFLSDNILNSRNLTTTTKSGVTMEKHFSFEPCYHS